MKALESASWGGISVPRVLEFQFEGAESSRFQRKEDRQRTSALQELSRIERFGAKLFLGGEILGFRGTGLLNDSLPAIYSFTLIKH
jgi:hypothetical protein